jgi:hypothetical protein
MSDGVDEGAAACETPVMDAIASAAAKADAVRRQLDEDIEAPSA